MCQVRTEQAPDIDAVHALHLRAFEPSTEEAELVDGLRADADHIPELCLVALRDGEVAGHIAFSRARLDTGATVAVLAPVGVLPERQRSGIGAALVEEGLSRAHDTGLPLVIVLGHADYYPRFGFEPAKPLGIEAPFPVPDEAWMALRLPAYAGERGTVVYPRAFGIL